MEKNIQPLPLIEKGVEPQPYFVSEAVPMPETEPEPVPMSMPMLMSTPEPAVIEAESIDPLIEIDNNEVQSLSENASQESLPVLHLTSYRKILFSFGSHQPWGRLITMTSHQLVVNSFAPVPDEVELKPVEIRFAKDLIIEIKFEKKESNLYFFTPTNMHAEKISRLNKWFKEIAVAS